MSVEITKYGNFATARLMDEETGGVVQLSIGNRGIRFETKSGDVFLLIGNDLRDVLATYLDIYNGTLASS